MSTQYIHYPNNSGSGGGVTSLNSLTGALTLVAGSGITITPSGSSITIAATGGGSGTVTSVALADGSTSPIYTISGSPVTTSGTLTLTLSTQAANTVFAGPASGGNAQPTFRALVAADVPSLTGLYANRALSNLAGTAVNTNLLPGLTGTYSLGNASFEWTEMYANTAIVIGIENGIGGNTIQINMQDGYLIDASNEVAVSWGGVNKVLNDNTGALQLTWNTTGVIINNDLQFNGGSGNLTMQAASGTTAYTMIWPNAQAGAVGDVLTYNGSNAYIWAPATSATGNFLVNEFTLSPTDITNKYVTLSQVPAVAAKTLLTVIGGPMQSYGADFTVSGSQLSWSGLFLDGVLVSGDMLVVEFS